MKTKTRKKRMRSMVEVRPFCSNSSECSKLDGVNIVRNNNKSYLFFFYKNSNMVKAVTSDFAYDLTGLDYLQYPHRKAFGIPSIHRKATSSTSCAIITRATFLASTRAELCRKPDMLARWIKRGRIDGCEVLI